MEFLSWVRTQWDRATAVVACAAGALALILGWIGVSGTTNPAGQIPYLLSGGLVAIFLLSLASTLWLSADLRDEWRKLDRLEQRLDRSAAEEAKRSSARSVDGRSTPKIARRANPGPGNTVQELVSHGEA